VEAKDIDQVGEEMEKNMVMVKSMKKYKLRVMMR